MITNTIIILTAITSSMAFKDVSLFNKLIFYPPAVGRGQWYRLFSYGCLHANMTHLIFNMFTLYLFGNTIEKVFKATLGTNMGSISYILLYVLALLVSILPTYQKHKHNTYYRSLGASGAVSAIVFSYIIINPMSFMGIMFIPIMLPAFIFGIIFIYISMRLDRTQAGGINHSAHIAGAVFGVVATIIIFFSLANINLVQSFISQIRINSINDLIHFGF